MTPQDDSTPTAMSGTALPIGAVIGIAVGCSVVAIALIVGVICYLKKAKAAVMHEASSFIKV